MHDTWANTQIPWCINCVMMVYRFIHRKIVAFDFANFIHMLFFLDRLYSNCLHPRNWRIWSSKWPTFVFTNLLPTYHCGEMWRHIFVQPPGAPLELNLEAQIQGVRGLQNDFHKKLDGMQRLHKRCLGSVHGDACGETGEQWRLDAVFFTSVDSTSSHFLGVIRLISLHKNLNISPWWR